MTFEISKNYTQLVTTAIHNAKYNISKLDGEDIYFSFLYGLATLSSVARDTSLASDIRVLCRVARRRRPNLLAADDEMRIALVAVSSHSDKKEWCTTLGDWATEIAAEVVNDDLGRRLLGILERLAVIEPGLLSSCSKAVAALSAFIGLDAW